jgi:hypothetical protein
VSDEHLEELLTTGVIAFGELRLTAGAEVKHRSAFTDCSNFGLAEGMPRFDKLLSQYVYLRQNPEFIREVVMRQGEMLRESVRLLRTPRVEKRWEELENAAWLFVDAGVMCVVPQPPAWMRSALMCWAFVMRMRGRLGKKAVYIFGNGQHTVDNMWWSRAVDLFSRRMSAITGGDPADAAILATALQGKKEAEMLDALSQPEVARAMARMNRAMEPNIQDESAGMVIRNQLSAMEPPRFRDVVAFYKEHPDLTFADRVETVFIPDRLGLAGVGGNAIL